MSLLDVQILGFCLIGMVLIYAGLEKFAGTTRARFTDLTRPAEFVDQAERNPAAPRQVNNALAVDRFRVRWEAGGHNLRPVPVRPEPRQIAAWEDDGGAPACRP